MSERRNTRPTRPTLNLRASYGFNANSREMLSPDSLASSIPATSSPLTPNDAEEFMFNPKEDAGTTLSDVFTGETSYFHKIPYHEDRTYLPPLSEVSDQGSIYSQDSACVVYTSKLRHVANPTPQSTLTFAAIWDPDHGMSMFSGQQLLGQEHSSANENAGAQEGNDNARLSNYFADNSEHPDCEPHLVRRHFHYLLYCRFVECSMRGNSLHASPPPLRRHQTTSRWTSARKIKETSLRTLCKMICFQGTLTLHGYPRFSLSGTLSLLPMAKNAQKSRNLSNSLTCDLKS
ncbi:hypothetical protein J3R30DRAFT_197111 [Lentinula aciculospora]|uniref:Uncharacterized protein n=1 Tax=Lentinula aciculospora TaxID=153920 RepID=A0A9W9DMH7_9AGAR|nr:hypothetical protein J3R30DRAFT_197111 [Lentinula aciculospora]